MFLAAHKAFGGVGTPRVDQSCTCETSLVDTLASMDDFADLIATRKKRSRQILSFKLLDPAVCIDGVPTPNDHEPAAGHSFDAIAFPVRDAESRSDQLPIRVFG
jgi:hypothetical protein